MHIENETQNLFGDINHRKRNSTDQLGCWEFVEDHDSHPGVQTTCAALACPPAPPAPAQPCWTAPLAPGPPRAPAVLLRLFSLKARGIYSPKGCPLLKWQAAVGKCPHLLPCGGPSYLLEWSPVVYPRTPVTPSAGSPFLPRHRFHSPPHSFLNPGTTSQANTFPQVLISGSALDGTHATVTPSRGCEHPCLSKDADIFRWARARLHTAPGTGSG